jgi:hypothetical protein
MSWGSSWGPSWGASFGGIYSPSSVYRIKKGSYIYLDTSAFFIPNVDSYYIINKDTKRAITINTINSVQELVRFSYNYRNVHGI